MKRLFWAKRVVRGIRWSQFLYCSNVWHEEGWTRDGRSLPPLLLLGLLGFLVELLPLVLNRQCRGLVVSSWRDLPNVSDRATDWSA